MPADDGQHQQVQQDAHSPQGGVPVAVLADVEPERGDVQGDFIVVIVVVGPGCVC